ncbi:diacylglycerol kinase [Burkholderia cenocepacia]|uniref:diacylglycerol kinase n=1 Tax=Burkholderia cenocepacia TaxID=95486 RepID=UPI0007C6E350|nr:diacylglycerol kinase [Burkholderia cenocepacia]
MPASKPTAVGVTRLLRAFRFSVSGIRVAWRDEAAFRQEVVGFAVLGSLTLGLPLPGVTKALLFAQMAGVLSTELVNSGLEAIVDKASPEHHPLAGKAKDCASAAVLVSCVALAGSWACLAGPAALSAVKGLL